MATPSSRSSTSSPRTRPTSRSYKPHILDDYREQQVPQLLNTQLNKLDDRAKVLNDLKKAAAEMNIPVKTSDLVGKDGQVPDLGAMSGPGAVAFYAAQGSASPARSTRAESAWCSASSTSRSPPPRRSRRTLTRRASSC